MFVAVNVAMSTGSLNFTTTGAFGGTYVAWLAGFVDSTLSATGGGGFGSRKRSDWARATSSPEMLAGDGVKLPGLASTVATKSASDPRAPDTSWPANAARAAASWAARTAAVPGAIKPA